MNDPLLTALLVYSIRDGILLLVAWWLIHRLASPAIPVVPASAPQPPAPPVAPQPQPKPRFIGITATSFAGSNDSVNSRTSAYDGKLIDGDRELAAALPGTVAAGRLIRAFYKGKTADIPVRDRGPWNTTDSYWDTGARPQAETGADKTGRKTNLSGIDLSPAAWKALGYVGDPQQAKDKIDWDFADVLDGKILPAPLPSGAVPAHLALMRRYRDLGVHAQHDSTYIMAWPAAIAAKYPEMTDYAKLYVHDTTPWCGLALADVLAENGIRPQFGVTELDRFLWANSWAQFGTAVTTPQPGDILVFRWAGGGHHVTLYDHQVDDNYYHCTGGNQGDGHAVTTEAMPMHNCIAIRRPPTT